MALIDDIRALTKTAGAKLQAVDWNKLIEGIADGISRSTTANTTANTAITRLNGIKKGRTLLWTGTAYLTGSLLNLSGSMDSYDCILVEMYMQGVSYNITDFKDASVRSFREFNLADSASSTTLNMFEFNLKRISDVQLQITGNKKQDMANGASSWSTPINDSDANYIKNIWGINFN